MSEQPAAAERGDAGRWAEQAAAAREVAERCHTTGTFLPSAYVLLAETFPQLCTELAAKAGEVDDKARIGHQVADAWQREAERLRSEIIAAAGAFTDRAEELFAARDRLPSGHRNRNGLERAGGAYQDAATTLGRILDIPAPAGTVAEDAPGSAS